MNYLSVVLRTTIIIPFCLLGLVSETDAAEASSEGYPRLMQGPMVGVVAPDRKSVV